MPLKIRVNDPSLFAGAILGGDGPVQFPPALVTPGAITPASGPVGTVFRITPPVFRGSPTPTVTRTVTLAGSPITVTGNSYTSTSAGALAAAWSASNGVGSPATSSASATVTGAPVVPSGLTVVSMPQVEPSAAQVGGVSTLVDPVVTGGTPPYTYVRALRAGGSGATNGVNLIVSASGDPLAIEWPSSANGVNAPYNAYYNVVVNDAAGATTGRLTANATVAAADAGGADLSAAAIYIPDTSDPAAGITTLTAQGRIAAVFNASGTGTIRTSPRGIEFDGAARLMSNGIDTSGGYFIAGRAVCDTGAGAIINLRTAGGQHLQVRRQNATASAWQTNWSYGTATNNNGSFMPSLVPGVEAVIGVEVNPTANTIRFWNGTAFNTMPLNANGDPVGLDASILRLGSDHASGFIDGALKDFVFEPLNGAQITLEQALAELGAEVTLPFP